MELIECLLTGIRQIITGESILLRSLCPIFVYPNPGPVIHVDKILVVKVYRRYYILDQHQLLIHSFEKLQKHAL
jgi:hypothetical protein